MVRLMSILSFAAVLGCLALATAADAQNNPHTSAALPPPPLTCVNQAKTVQVDVVISPEPCLSNSLGVVDCLKWSYKYTKLSGGNVSLSAITMDSDVDLVAATSGLSGTTTTGMQVYTPGQSDSGIGSTGLNTLDVRTIRFASNEAVVHGHVYTRRNVGIGSVTAVSKVGNAGPSTCQIAGADNIETSDSVGLAAITTTQIDEFEECRIVLALDEKGCPTSVTATPNTCVVEEVDVLDGKTVLGGQCNKPSGFVTDGSTCIWYCPTSTGKCFKVCK
jgi:hypothetical protein